MKKIDFLAASIEFRTEVLALACFAESMTLTVVVEGEGEDISESYPYKESGEKIMSACETLFKKGQAHIKSMFKSDNKEKYTELKFKDHLSVMKGKVLISGDHEQNTTSMLSLVRKIEDSARKITPQSIHFDSGHKWIPTNYDDQRQISIVSVVDEIKKMLS
jgi:hypothetical protein